MPLLFVKTEKQKEFYISNAEEAALNSIKASDNQYMYNIFVLKSITWVLTMSTKVWTKLFKAVVSLSSLANYLLAKQELGLWQVEWPHRYCVAK